MLDYDQEQQKNENEDQNEFGNDKSGKQKVVPDKSEKIFIHEFSKSKFVEFSTKYSYLPNYE